MVRMIHVRALLTAAMVVSAGLWIGCASPAGPFTAQNPYRIYKPCPNPGEDDLSYITYAATVLSITEEKWAIVSIEKNGGEIEAKRCEARKYTVGECLTLIFKPYRDGHVVVYSHDGEIIPSRVTDDAERWTDEFEVPFSKYRCYSREAIKEEMSKYDFAF